MRDAVSQVDFENLNCCAAARRKPGKYRPAPCEVVGPPVLTWSEGQHRRCSGLCDCCKRSKRDARKVNRYRSGGEFPVVSVSAFLKLADWYRAYRSVTQGGEPCPTDERPFSGPSRTGTASADKPAAALGSNSSRGSSASVANAQPHRSSTGSVASTQRGGGA